MKKKEKLIVIMPKTDAAKEKQAHHGEIWTIRGEEIPKYSRSKGMCYVIRSKDGTKVLYLSQENDKEFTYRLV